MKDKDITQIDPKNITNYNRTPLELQLFFMFCIFVANKPSNITARKVNNMFLPRYDNAFSLKVLEENPLIHDGGLHAPFAVIHIMIKFKLVEEWLQHWKVGQYHRFTKTMHDINNTFVLGQEHLDTITLENLMKITGMGMKSARFFLVHSRWDQPHAILDVHVLKWLKQIYGTDLVPKKTPSNPKDYKLLEGLFLGECVKWKRGPAEMDTFIWKYFHES